jgi:hypothetical protein
MKTTPLVCYRRLGSTGTLPMLAIFAFMAPTTGFGASAQSAPKLELAVAAAVVQHAVAKYQTRSSPKLESAELTFKVASGNSVGVGISFWIITIGASRTETNVQTVTFSYKVPPDSDKPSPSPASIPSASPWPETPTLNRELLGLKTLENLNLEAFADKDVNQLAAAVTERGGYHPPDVKEFQDGLIKAIDGAAKAARETPRIGGAVFQTFAVTIDYSVKFEGTGSAMFPVFQMIMLGPKGSISRESTHSLKLVFTK